MRINTTIQQIYIFIIKNGNGKTSTLNLALIPTPVTPPDAPQWIRQRATVPKGNKSYNVEGENFNRRTYCATTIQARGTKMQKLKHPFKRVTSHLKYILESVSKIILPKT